MLVLRVQCAGWLQSVKCIFVYFFSVQKSMIHPLYSYVFVDLYSMLLAVQYVEYQVYRGKICSVIPVIQRVSVPNKLQDTAHLSARISTFGIFRRVCLVYGMWHVGFPRASYVYIQQPRLFTRTKNTTQQLYELGQT